MSVSALKTATAGKQETGKTLATIVAGEGFRRQMAMALPKHLTADRMARVALTEMKKTPKLLECEPESFLGAVMVCAQLGLEPGNAMGHAYLIPYKTKRNINGKDVFILEAQLIIGYRGMLDIARRSGQIVSLSVRTVYENDHFKYSFGLNETVDHTPADGERGNLTFVYAVAHLVGGGYQFEVMSRHEVDKIRAQSKASSSGPWVSHYDEMAKKTVIRRLFKYLPISIEMQRAVNVDEGSEVGMSAADFLDGEFSVDDTPTAAIPQKGDFVTAYEGAENVIG